MPKPRRRGFDSAGILSRSSGQAGALLVGFSKAELPALLWVGALLVSLATAPALVFVVAEEEFFSRGSSLGFLMPAPLLELPELQAFL